MKGSNVLILTKSSNLYSVTPKTTNNSSLILSTSSKLNCTKDLLIVANPDNILKVLKEGSYIIPYKNKYLETDNYFSEFDTREEQLIARKNLGVEGLAYWGNIEGYLEDLTDLYNYVQQLTNNLGEDLNKLLDEQLTQLSESVNNKVSIELNDLTEASKQIKFDLKNPDFELNNDFNNALEGALEGETILSIDDAIRVIMYKLFPITYTNYILSISNSASKTYTIENGTSKSVDLNDVLGNIIITVIPGNKKDQLTSLKFNDTELLELSKISYTIPIKVSDITLLTSLTSNVSKTFKVELTTDLPYSTQQDVLVTITVNKQSYYFLEIYDELPETDVYVPSELTKTTDNVKTFNLYTDKKYLTVYAPKDINTVETATSTDGINWGSFSVTTGYHKKLVTYTPTGGLSLTYYRITLDAKQSNHVKIRVS